YFTTSLFDLDKPLVKDLHGIDSFIVAMVLEGSGTLECLNCSIDLRQGTTVLIPASAPNLRFAPHSSLKLITSYIR
nr:mannose-6-phosphate isomerase [Bacteroidales bacterium]